MKVIRLHALGDLRIHEEPLPHCGLDEVLVRVRAVPARRVPIPPNRSLRSPLGNPHTSCENIPKIAIYIRELYTKHISLAE